MTRNVTSTSAHVRLDLESRAENVALVRSALSAIAVATGLDPELVIDIKTALSEACNNVVVHAYDDGPGPLIVTVDVTAGYVDATVRDHGSGITQLGGRSGHMGLGLGVMSALASRFEVIRSEQGTEVRMCFSRAAPAGTGLPAEPVARIAEPPAELSGDAVMWVYPPELLATVFGRVLRAYAAAWWFTADRVDELSAVSDALAELAAGTGTGTGSAEPVGVAIAAARRRLKLVAGPFPRAAADAPDAPQGRLRELVEEFRMHPLKGRTKISFAINDRSAAPG